jgi:hypothetical protein
MHFNRFLSGLTLALLASVSGCGGGGGSASNGGTGAVIPPPVVSVSGLVPEAGTAGATLYADAAPLRVLRDGAVWTYHGVDQPYGAASGPSQVRAYTNTVKHAATSGGMLENGSNAFNGGPDTAGPLRFEGGSYKYTEHISLTANAPAQTVDVIELRSPVKINDQYVSLDRHIADGGVDLDGDKVNDALDVAMYARVIGEEVLDLPNRRQVKTVHVDITLRARIISSKTGAPSPLYEAVQSNWYAPGLGIVQTRGSEPNANDPTAPNRVVTEILQNWDGLTEGLGYISAVAGVAPVSSPLAGAAFQFPLDAVGFDTHAVVATFIPGQPSAVGIAIAQLDTRGNVLAARSYTRAELFPAAQYFTEPRLLRVGSELRLLARTDNDGVSMVAFEPTGQRILRPAVTMLSDPLFGYDTERTSYRVSTDGSGIWLGWLRIIPAPNSVYLRSLAVQHFDASGHALGTARVMLDPVNADIGNFSMALSDTRLALAWRQSGLEPVSRLAMIDTGSGALLADKTVGTGACDYASCIHFDVLALQPGIAMVGWNPPVSPIGAARLDASGEPVLSAATTLLTDTLKAPWLTPSNGPPVFKGLGGQLTVSTGQIAKYWPEDTLDSGFTSVFQTSGISGPLAASEPVLLARILGSPVNVLTTVQLGNRLLLIGSDGASYLNSMVVWKAN